MHDIDTRWAARVALALALAAAGPARATIEHVDVQTTGLPATFVLAFDFIDGGAPSNRVTLSDFSSDGSLGSATRSGDAAGSLPGGVALGDASFFNEYLVPITGAHRIAFDFDYSNNTPPANAVPDAFSFFLLDAQGQLPLFHTSDPSGADALFALQLDGSAQGWLTVDVASSGPAATWSVAPVVATVPEPATGWLLLAGLGALGACRRRGAGERP